MAFADDVKAYLNISDDLTSYIATAESYLTSENVPVNESDKLYLIAVSLIVEKAYHAHSAFIADVNAYCGTDDDVSNYISAAEVTLANAGIPIAESNPEYGMAVKMMVSCWYDNRVPDPANKAVNVPQPYGLQGIILQLQMSQEAT